VNRPHERARRAVPDEPDTDEASMTTRILPEPGTALTAWSGEGIVAAVRDPHFRALVTLLAPLGDALVIQLHSGPRDLCANGAEAVRILREYAPDARLWAGIGCDGWLDGVTAKARTVDEAAQWILRAARTMVFAGCECIVWNAETAYKRNPIAGTQLAGIVISKFRQEFPRIPQGHTSFDHPTYHSDATLNGHGVGPLYSAESHAYPWRGWCGPDLDEYPGCVDFALAQNYVAPDQVAGSPPIMAGRGALAHRILTSTSSFDTAKRLGWIVPDLPVYPYVQLHHVPYAQTVTCTAECPIVAGWAAPARIDADGAISMRALCALRQGGYTGPGAIDRFLEAEKRAGRYTGAIDHTFGQGGARALGLIS
jgi:hypothetical protein